MKISWNDFVEQCQNCQACDLAATRTNVVIYRGSVVAPVMFVGEGPGATEDEQGLPFVGQAGRLLQLPTFHPAYILRNNNERIKLWKDIELVRRKAEEMGLIAPLPVQPDMPTERPSSKG